MSEKPELEPCPFCGGTEAVGPCFDDAAEAPRIGCGACGVLTGIPARREDRTEANAIRAWNRRAK